MAYKANISNLEKIYQGKNDFTGKSSNEYE